MKIKFLALVLTIAAGGAVEALAQNPTDAPPTVETQTGPLQKSLPLTRKEVVAFARQIAGADKAQIPAQLDTFSALIRLRGVVFAATPETDAELVAILGGANGKTFDYLEQIRTNTGGPRPAKNETIEVRRADKVRPAKIVEVNDKGYVVEYVDAAPIDSGQKETVLPNSIWRIIPGEQLAPMLVKGVPIQVQGTDAATKTLRWFDAEIVSVETTGYKVRIAGGVTEAVVRPRFLRRAVAVSPDKNTTKVAGGLVLALKKGQWVEILWGAKWWKGHILAVDEVAGKYKVHYDGWGDNWDEWVAIEKVR